SLRCSCVSGISGVDDTHVFISSGGNVRLSCNNALPDCNSTTWNYNNRFRSDHCIITLNTTLLNEDHNREWRCEVTQRDQVQTSVTYTVKRSAQADSTTAAVIPGTDSPTAAVIPVHSTNSPTTTTAVIPVTDSPTAAGITTEGTVKYTFSVVLLNPLVSTLTHACNHFN
uniref:Ig-like domain-containing protein n=1 Tax=Cyprinus carpio TaxID=7962 RepID=A0A8C1LW57_CYPCA